MQIVAEGVENFEQVDLPARPRHQLGAGLLLCAAVAGLGLPAAVEAIDPVDAGARGRSAAASRVARPVGGVQPAARSRVASGAARPFRIGRYSYAFRPMRKAMMAKSESLRVARRRLDRLGVMARATMATDVLANLADQRRAPWCVSIGTARRFVLDSRRWTSRRKCTASPGVGRRGLACASPPLVRRATIGVAIAIPPSLTGGISRPRRARAVAAGLQARAVEAEHAPRGLESAASRRSAARCRGPAPRFRGRRS